MKKEDLKKLLVVGAAVTAAAAATTVALTKRRRRVALLEKKTKTLADKNAYITGGGLSASAAALYLIRDCGLNPRNVHIFAASSRERGNGESGYICRRGGIIDDKSSMNLFDLVSGVSSLDIPDLTVCDEILNLYRANPKPRRITLIDSDCNVVDISKIKVDRQHRNDIAKLMRREKEELMTLPLCDAIGGDFFISPLWKIMASTYGFSEESSSYEFISCLSHMQGSPTGTMPAEFDRYEEIVMPLEAQLKSLGADIREGAAVTDIDFEEGRVSAVHFTDGNIRKTFYLNDGDICIAPTEDFGQAESLGSFNENAPKNIENRGEFWKNISAKMPEVCDFSPFFNTSGGDISAEFTITLSNRLLPELIDKVTCGALGNDGIIVLDNSEWKMAICAVPTTHFKNMSEDGAVIWGCAHRIDNHGKKIRKAMTDCSGEEILYELISCFNLSEAWDDIRESVINVIPCLRTHEMSRLASAKKLEIIPAGTENLAFCGDFARFDGADAFSEEYRTATAREAAYKLMKTNKKLFSQRPKSGRDVKKSLKNLCG